MKKLSKRDEQLLIILIVLAIVLAVYYLMIIPFKDKLEEENKKREMVKSEYSDLINANNKPDEYKKGLVRLREGIRQRKTLVPDKIEKIELWQKKDDIEKIIAGRKVKCELGGSEKFGNAVRNKVVASFRLSYGELESLINKICSYEQKTGVDNIRFTIDNNTLVGTMDVYFYSKA